MDEFQAHATVRPTNDRPQLVLVSANSCWNIVNFRAGLIRGLQAHGYRIVVAAPDDDDRPKLADLGVEFVPVPINSAGLSPVEDLRLLASYVQLFRELKPLAFLGFTAKPHVYGSLAARPAGAKVINNVTGLGTAFIKRRALTALVTQLYRFAFRGSSTYREGLPRALLEGSAMAKPLIATDVPGCRDVVEDGKTGYLCADRSADSLAAAMLKMIETPASERLRMGELDRRKIEQEFCETRVIDHYIDALSSR